MPSSSIDIILSHDWPNGIHNFGNTDELFRRKKHLSEDSDDLGAPPLFKVMKKLQPTYWFAAHIHVKFAAIYNKTKFLSLDKPIRVEDFVQIIPYG